VLRARIERVIPFSVPIAVSISLPPGVTADAGATEFTVPASSGPGTTEHEITVHYTGTPPTDIVLEAQVSGDDFGITARDHYRFGRPARKLALPPIGDNLRIGGRDFGPSVPLPNP
jgi:hypothetical protein